MAKLACLVAAAAISLTVATAGGTSAMAFLNAAGSGVTLMKGCDNWGHFEPGQSQTLNFPPGENKLWVVPDGCTQEEGCYSCHLDCLGCFYLSAVVAADGTIVTGIGYGHNDPVVVHGRVGNATFSAKNQWGKEEALTCSVASCDFSHIVQAQAGTGKFTVGFLPLI